MTRRRGDDTLIKKLHRTGGLTGPNGTRHAERAGERAACAATGATPTRNSGRGASARHKGDGTIEASAAFPAFREDAKFHAGRSKSVTVEMLQKITIEALQGGVGVEPCLVLVFAHVPVGVDAEWALIPARLLRR